MAKRSSSIEIDGRKFRDAILKRGLHLSVISDELGFSPSYFQWQIKKNYTTKGTATALEKLYGIPKEEYVIPEDKEEEAPKAADPVFSEDDIKALKDVVFQSVYSGVYAAIDDAIKANGLVEALEALREAWK